MALVVYLVIGALLAVPYCWLAGWKSDYFFFVTYLAPAFLFIWVVLAALSGVIGRTRSNKYYFDWRATYRKAKHEGLPGALPFFRAWTIYIFLPIIFHWNAELLAKIGYEVPSAFLNTYRYESMFFVFIVVVGLFGILSLHVMIRDSLRNLREQFIR